MAVGQRKAELAKRHLRLSLDHARIAALAHRHPERAEIYDRAMTHIRRELSIVEARLALFDKNMSQHHGGPPSPEAPTAVDLAARNPLPS
jgi:hypothetical protein